MIKKYHVLSNAATFFNWTHYFYIFEKLGLDTFLKIVADNIINPDYSIENIKLEVDNVNSEINYKMKAN